MHDYILKADLHYLQVFILYFKGFVHDALCCVDVVIGFDPVQDSFPEESGQGEVTVRILSGELERDVAVLLSTASGTAESEYFVTSRLSLHTHFSVFFRLYFLSYYPLPPNSFNPLICSILFFCLSILFLH